MSKARLASLASVLLALVLLAGLGWIGWLLYDSRLPGSYNAMDLAVPDYGGGVHASHGGMSGRTIEQLQGPEGLVPDFREDPDGEEGHGRTSVGPSDPGFDLRRACAGS